MILFPSAIYPEVGLLGDMVVLFLVFWGNLYTAFCSAVPVYISTNCTQGFAFLYILAMASFYMLANWSPERVRKLKVLEWVLGLELKFKTFDRLTVTAL